MRLLQFDKLHKTSELSECYAGIVAAEAAHEKRRETR